MFPAIRVYCCVCGKQAVSYMGSPIGQNYDPDTTTFEGGRAGFKPNEIFCGYCAKDLDENGLFPEERSL